MSPLSKFHSINHQLLRKESIMDTKIDVQKYEYRVSKYDNYKGNMVTFWIQTEQELSSSGET